MRPALQLVLLALLGSSAAWRLPLQPVSRTPSAAAAPATECEPASLGPAEAFNHALVTGLKGAIDLAYADRAIPRFFVLETVARVPYFSYLSCLHLYESLGMRGRARLMRVHYAEADNELHHLLIMEALGGGDAFIDRFLASHMALLYFWYCVGLYLLYPRAAYHLSELVEEHAYNTYDAHLRAHEDELKEAPVPEVARRYYEGADALRDLLDGEAGAADANAARERRKRPRRMRNLYDVFVRVRDDEAAHWDTLARLVAYDSLDAPEGCDVLQLA